ncbi:MAG: hypothetical protein HDQ44_02835 [Desulfovibrio sp.]|nr:hypothetical protein [Desulfovibrio sp.]
MDIKITPVKSKRDLTEFVKLPFAIHANNPLWTPQLKKAEAELLTPGKHPFWESASRELFLAELNGKPAGRIAAIVDDKYNAYSNEQAGAFGFFECVEEREVAGALIDRAAEWLAQRGLDHMRGPLNPSANYTCGMLASGFEQAPAIMMPWNPPYYPYFMEACGLRKEQDLFAYVIDRSDLTLKPELQAEAARLKALGRFSCRPASAATLQADIHAMLDIYRLAWADNWGFSPLSPAEADRHVRELKDVVDPDFFVLFFEGEKPVAGMVALPDLSPLLRRLNGALSLTAPWHFWRSRREIKAGARIMLFGILPEYRLQGLPLLLLDYILAKAARRPALQWVEGSWILEDNLAMNELMEDFSGRLLKRYRIYRKEIGPCQA